MGRAPPSAACGCLSLRGPGPPARLTSTKFSAERTDMRILQMGPYPPPHGGVQTHVVAIREHLRKNHIPCAVINLTRHRKPAADEVYYPKSSLEVLRLLARLRYDVIHLHIGGNL